MKKPSILLLLILLAILIFLAIWTPAHAGDGPENHTAVVRLTGDTIITLFPVADHRCDEIYARAWYTSPTRPNGAWTNSVAWSLCSNRVEIIRPGGVRLWQVEFSSAFPFDLEIDRLFYLPVLMS